MVTNEANTSKISKYLRPERFNVDPNEPMARLQWSHWKYTFENFIAHEASDVSDTVRLQLLMHHVAPCVYSYISDSKDLRSAFLILDSIYNKPTNVVHARHVLRTRKQQAGEDVDQFLRALKLLAKECEFKSVTDEQYANEYVRDTFIEGLNSSKVRQKLLENLTLTLEDAYNQARALEMAESNAQSYPGASLCTSHVDCSPNAQSEPTDDKSIAAIRHNRLCFFCGGKVHPRRNCPAANATCQLCLKKGHFANVCRSSARMSNKTSKPNVFPARDTSSSTPLAMISAAAPGCLRKTTVPVVVNDSLTEALIDTGSSVSFISQKLFQSMHLKKKPCLQTVTLATTNHVSHVEGTCTVTLKLDPHTYKDVELLIVSNLCADIIIGYDILKDHSKMEVNFGGTRQPLKICCVMAAEIPPVSLFSNLSPDSKPIAIKSRRHSKEDEEFIEREIAMLLSDGVIELSNSPWRAQVLVTKNSMHRKRLVIDYSQTVNKFTWLDAYPLPNIESVVSKIAENNYFSTIDLKSAYHQIPINRNERHYTAFEAGGNLYQFTRIPFGVTNGVSAFQRTMNWIIRSEKLKGVIAYLDDITVFGKSKEEHDTNLKRFMESAFKYKLTINTDKTTFCTDRIKLLGYSIRNNTIQPDEDRLKPLLDLPPPNDLHSLRRAIGMLSHYCKWIPKFSQKIAVLANTKAFPLSNEAVRCFEDLKKDIARSSLTAVDDNEQFVVETDASDHTVAASLSQNGRPIAFFSRTLSPVERNHAAIEKEAAAIVEALRKWRHYLIGRPFLLITDQQSVSFIFHRKNSSKIKNEKIQRWRLELSCFKYDIVYRPGKENVVADTLSRVCASATSESQLYKLHCSLCHPGVTRMTHWVRSKNLPFSVEEIRKITASCSICAQIKPRFHKKEYHLIKATSPFERLNIDFKGPLPTSSRNNYLLTIIDEYSRFPFAYPCTDTSALTVIKHLKNLFSIFGTPAYIHSDRGSAFMASEFKAFLHSRGVCTSHSTPYNPQGNGQVERLNGTLWRNIQLALKSKGLLIPQWEQVLEEALHAIRSLLCTSTNETPHERMFTHPRRSSNGNSMPSWLIEPGPVLMKNANRRNKYEPIVQEVELVEANPSYSFVRLPDGREVPVSNKQLAPAGGRGEEEDEEDNGDAGGALEDDGRDQINEGDVQENWEIPSSSTPSSPENTPEEPQEDASAGNASPAETNPPLPNPQRTPGSVVPDSLRRSQRTRRRPDRLSDFICSTR